MSDNNEWIISNGKRLRHPNNSELVTARCNIINGKKVIRISIGIDVCELLDFKKGERVYISINKKYRNYLIISKDVEDLEGYKLSHSSGHKNNFMSFQFRYETSESFRLSQTIILDYDINDENLLLIDVSRLKWSN